MSHLTLFGQTSALAEAWNHFGFHAASPKTIFTSTRPSTVPNFREVAEVSHLYRSSSIDDLATLFTDDVTENQWCDSERFILDNSTLWMDLRSPAEQDHDKLDLLLRRSSSAEKPWREVHLNEGMDDEDLEQAFQESDTEIRYRTLAYVDLMNMSRMVAYAESHVAKQISSSSVSLSGENSTTAISDGIADPSARVIKVLYPIIQERGIEGIFEIILDSNGMIGIALKTITIHLEHNPGNGGVVFYCTVGKDRTGIIAMLAQLLMGVPDATIVNDFAKSASVQSFVAHKLQTEMKLSSGISNTFSQAPPDAMIQTLQFLRGNYGSITTYLDSVGFDESWQKRFQSSVSR